MAELKSGFTTGTCAAIATKAALKMLFEQQNIASESVMTPKGIEIETVIEDAKLSKLYSSCAVRKDAGDDPDVTNGILVYSKVEFTEGTDIIIDGGIGVGRVTKPGLWQEIGEAAINKVPRQMIADVVKEQLDIHDYEGGVKITISVPQGVEIARKTFNPRLGIEGGISILGTSGVVEPMSEQAIIDTIKVEIDVKKANEGDYLMIAPGNYGIDFIKESYNVDLEKAVKCSNFVGEALDFAEKAGFKGLLMIGHIGKFVKLAGGIMNTHSKNADSRMELLAVHAAFETDDIKLVRKIMDCVTTDDAIAILKEAGICDAVMKRILEKALFYVGNRVENELEIGMVIFSNEHGLLAQSDNAEQMFQRFKVN